MLKDKHCPKCAQVKSVTDYYLRKSGARTGQLTSWCKNCIKEKMRKYHTPRRIRQRNLFQYGLTIKQYGIIHKKQKGICKICNQKETTIRSGKLMRLSVDHDHKTGKIRGLLCNNCNRALGLLKDNVAIINKLQDYLKVNEYDSSYA